MILCNCKLDSFPAKSFNKPLKYYILGNSLNLNLESSNFELSVVFAVSSFVGNPVYEF